MEKRKSAFHQSSRNHENVWTHFQEVTSFFRKGFLVKVFGVEKVLKCRKFVVKIGENR